ncbi:MAG TPA: MBL fold metallo-hydrolase [Rariglobus sp.]|nr:MBL fold metallo-hydrolase [Rariglobus sp.]
MVIEHAPMEDELGDVLDKAMRHAGLNEQSLATLAHVEKGKICDAIDYRYDLTADELKRLGQALSLNELGVGALAAGRYPLPEIAGLPFCLYPLRTPHGIGVANAYIVADCGKNSGVLFDTGSDPVMLRRVWPSVIKKLDGVFITHAETEHTGGLADVVKQFGPVPVFCPVDAKVSGAAALGEDARVTLGGFEIRALATPGHAEAHNCYEVRVTKVKSGAPLLVSGDLFFAGSVGGAYFCSQQLRRHLARLLTAMTDETVVAPGHGPLTTIKNERTFNPFVL